MENKRERKREREFSKRASISVKTARDEQQLGHSWFVNSIYQLLFTHRHVRDINVPSLMVLHVTGVELETTRNKSVNEVSDPTRHPYFQISYVSLGIQINMSSDNGSVRIHLMMRTFFITFEYTQVFFQVILDSSMKRKRNISCRPPDDSSPTNNSAAVTSILLIRLTIPKT